MRRIRSFLHDQWGATAVEYGLIIAAVAVAALFLFFLLGKSLNRARSNAGESLGSEVHDAGLDGSFIRVAPKPPN